MHEAPYAEGARALGRRVFLCCGDAGLFTDRLHELVSQVLPLADARAPFPTPRPWFLHEVESDDARATAFALGARRDPAGLPALWNRLGLSWAPPFTRQRLESVAAAAARKVAEAA